MRNIYIVGIVHDHKNSWMNEIEFTMCNKISAAIKKKKVLLDDLFVAQNTYSE